MSEPRVLAVAWTPLSRTRVCVSCEAIFLDAYRACPACASEQVMPLARWLASVRHGETGVVVMDGT